MEVVYKMAENNEEIKNWVEKNGGKPAIIDDPDVTVDKTGLRIDWPGKKDEGLLSTDRKTTRDINWDEFFSIMDRNHLGFMYDDRMIDVSKTWSYKFVNLDVV